VSRKHGLLFLDKNGNVTYQDISANGSWIKMEYKKRIKLNGGLKLRFGEYEEFTVEQV